jgi:threonine/homoserine/homoserine lactone efflux protein
MRSDAPLIEMPMSTILTTVLAGAGVGLSIAAPIGPTSMLCIQRTLAAGLLTGLATGFGVATVHLTYGTLAAGWGTAFVAAWADPALLSLVSGLVLLVFAARVLRRVPVLSGTLEPRRTLAASYCGAVGLGFLNPLTPVLFAAATPTLLGHACAPMAALVGGVFLGSFGWWIALSGAVSLLRGRLTCRTIALANKAAGLVLVVLALGMLAKGGSVALDVRPFGWTGGRIAEAAVILHHQSMAADPLPGPMR